MDLGIIAVLLLASALAWTMVALRPVWIRQWWAEASDAHFQSSPALDVGLMYLVAVANLLIVLLLAVQLGLRQLEFAGLGASPVAGLRDHGSSVPDTDPGTGNDNDRVAATTEVVMPQFFQALAQTVFSLMAGVAIVGLMVWGSRRLYGSTTTHWGWGPLVAGKWWPTCRLGLLCFFLLVPAVLLLHVLLSWLVPYEHETKSEFGDYLQARRWDLIALTYVWTAGWVPIAEEIGFRVVLQGFAEQFVRFRGEFLRWLLGPLRPEIATGLGIDDAAARARAARPQPTGPVRPDSTAFWGPIVFSSLLFAFAHWGQGAAPISLYFLALGLGFIYKTTGNIGVCILIHVLLNLFSLTSLFWRA